MSLLQTDCALLIDKPAGPSSFGIVDKIKKSIRTKYQLKFREMPKIGHGGTLDPFATGLLVVLLGRASKLSRYFLNSKKHYSGEMVFGQTTASGDPTDEETETQPLPTNLSLKKLQSIANQMTSETYFQIPPMHSAKKQNGKRLYLLAREGLEVERDPIPHQLYSFDIQNLENGRSNFNVSCTAGAFIRTLSKDVAIAASTIGMLQSLRRTGSGSFSIENAMSVEAVTQAIENDAPLEELKGFLPFGSLLSEFDFAEANQTEFSQILMGQQGVLRGLSTRLTRAKKASNPNRFAVYHSNQLVAVVVNDSGEKLSPEASTHSTWKLERVFPIEKT